MKLLAFLANTKKQESNAIIHKSRLNRNLGTAEEQREALILTGRQQFKKLVDLGLKIPIAVL